MRGPAGRLADARPGTRLLPALLAAAGLLLLSASARGAAPPAASRPTAGGSASGAVRDAAAVTAVAGVTLSVSDLDRSVAFYEEVLGFREVAEDEREGEALERLQGVFPGHVVTARLALGSEEIELAQWLAPRGRAIPEGARSDDRSFQHLAIVVSDMDRAYARLRERRVAHASSSPQTLPSWNPNAGGIRAFYFRDPDGHPLEVIWYPPGKGDPRWQARDRLFLGIDHTAITVADTDASLRFWRDALGMRVAGESDNSGVEQERLNAVFGAHLRITALRSGSGIGVELLEYLTPRTGRPYPADANASDLVFTETRARVASATEAERSLRAARAAFVSPAVQPAPRRDGGEGRALLVRDPDGHAVLLFD